MKRINELNGSIIGSRIRVTDKTNDLLIEGRLFGFEVNAERIMNVVLGGSMDDSVGRVDFTLKFSNLYNVSASEKAIWEVLP